MILTNNLNTYKHIQNGIDLNNNVNISESYQNYPIIENFGLLDGITRARRAVANRTTGNTSSNQNSNQRQMIQYRRQMQNMQRGMSGMRNQIRRLNGQLSRLRVQYQQKLRELRESKNKLSEMEIKLKEEELKRAKMLEEQIIIRKIALISQKIETIQTEFKKHMDIYNQRTKLNELTGRMIRNKQHEITTDKFLQTKFVESDFDTNKLNNLQTDIDTVERQVQISENETLRKNNYIFQLKIIFIFLLVCSIPSYMMKVDKMTDTQGIISIGVVSIILIIILFKNFLNHRYSNVNDINTQNWIKPDIEMVVRDQTQIERTKQEFESKLKNMSPLDKLEFIVSQKKTKAINNENYSVAGHYDDIIKSITYKLARGDIYGGYGSDQGILDYIEKLNSDEESEHLNRQNELERQQKLIQQNITNQENTIKNIKNTQNENRNNNSKLNDTIKELQDKLKFEKNQLNNISIRKQKLSKKENEYGVANIDDIQNLTSIRNFKSIGTV